MTKIRNKRPVVFLLFISVLLHTNACHSSRRNTVDVYFRVIKVVDGDTFWIDDGSEKGQKIRLIGVDAPESRRTNRKQVGYYGKESKEYLTDLLLDKDIRMEYDIDRTDRYGRTLAYVYLKDGTFVNGEMVKQGYAMVMTVPPNVKYAEEFAKFQGEARQQERGLWNK